METLRLARRLVLFGGFTAGAFLFLLATVPIVRLAGGEPIAWRARVMRFWARASGRMIGMRLRVDGAPPTPPCFLVANHLSYMDIVVIASQLPCTFLAKSEIAAWPVFGRLCRAAGILFIERENKRAIPRVIESLRETLGKGISVVVFPEATTSPGATVLPFRPALLEVAVRERMPVSCAAITYRTPDDSPPAHRVVCWWGDMTFERHFTRLFRIRRFDASLTFGTETFVAEDRKTLADRLRLEVLTLFHPVVATDEVADEASKR